MAKPAFPQTPEGVTDWETVFEDPEQGLIVAVTQAPNADALRGCLLAVIGQLYTRKDDELATAQLLTEIDSLFADAQGTMPTQSVINLLRAIKNQRIAKAQAYLAKKDRAKADRRGHEFGRKVQRLTYLFFKNPRLLAAATGAMLILAIGLFFSVEGLVPDAGPSKPASLPPALQSPATAPAAKPAPLPRAPYKSEDKPEELPPVVLFKHLSIPRAFGERQVSNSLVLPAAVLVDRDALRDVCAEAPVIYHELNVAFSDALAAGASFSKSELARIGDKLADKLNTKIGERLIERVLLIRGPDLSVFARHNCAIASDAMIEKLDEFKR